MKLNLLLFGIASDLVGTSALTLEIPTNATISDFKKKLQQEYPQTTKMSTFVIAVNEEYATNELVLEENDTVAIIPPVSGG